MAKKKTTQTSPAASKSKASEPAARSAAKKAPAKAPAKTTKAAKPAAQKTPAVGLPTIDTGAAAAAAAALVRNRAILAEATGDAAGGKKESESFKQFKQGLTKPQGPGGILQGPTQQRKYGPGSTNEQVSHNQTFGADANRAFVPRRTSTG